MCTPVALSFTVYIKVGLRGHDIVFLMYFWVVPLLRIIKENFLPVCINIKIARSIYIYLTFIFENNPTKIRIENRADIPYCCKIVVGDVFCLSMDI